MADEDSNPVMNIGIAISDGVFKRLAVDVYFSMVNNQAVLIQWAMDQAFTAPGPYTFTLQRGYAANDNTFEDIATTTDQPWAYDNRPVFPQLGESVFYRVKLVDGDGDIYYSQAVDVSSYWTRYDWTLAREIVRKETMLLRKRTGSKGWLLKRRMFGDPCPDCVEPGTGKILNANCPDCYGTGIVGGYYPAFEYWVSFNPNARLSRLDPNVGLMVQIIETVRGLAYPVVETNDMWVMAHTNRRYLVMEDIAGIAKHRGIDLVLNLRLKEMPQSHPAYKVPTPCQ